MSPVFKCTGGERQAGAGRVPGGGPGTGGGAGGLSGGGRCPHRRPGQSTAHPYSRPLFHLDALLAAARTLRLAAGECLVLEDALTGVHGPHP